MLTEVPDLVRGMSLDHYHALIDGGLLEGMRIELLEGELVETVPNGPEHASTAHKIADAIRAAVPTGWQVRMQLPITVAPRSEPEPDVAVVADVDYVDDSRAHPTTAVLVVEVAWSSVRVDLLVKPGISAAAGVPEYWVVDVDERVVHVHRGVLETGYASVTVHREGVLTSATDPAISIDPEAVLPRPLSAD